MTRLVPLLRRSPKNSAAVFLVKPMVWTVVSGFIVPRGIPHDGGGFGLFDVGDFLATAFVGFIELLDAGAEKIVGVLVVTREQAGFRFFVGFQFPVRMDVGNIGEFFCVAADKYGPVAVQRIFFRTHQGDPCFGDSDFEAFQTFLKHWRLCDAVIFHPVADVALTFVTAGTEFLAEEDIADAVFFELPLQRRTTEPRQTAKGPGSDVGHNLDAVLL